MCERGINVASYYHFGLDFRIVPSAGYFRIVPSVVYFRIVPSAVYFSFHFIMIDMKIYRDYIGNKDQEDKRFESHSGEVYSIQLHVINFVSDLR